ncbi:MAG: GNAT family N-acetyltransferase [Mesorhizobium sp.]|nr:MAG: GNAT family N-acetyltransferase [Mesorhizobium sp.]
MIVWGTSKTSEINDALAAFVGDRIDGGYRGFGAHTSMGLIDGDRLLAAVVFHNYNPEAAVIEFSAASITERWLTRPVLWAMFSYAFHTAGCRMVVMRVAEDNEARNGRGIKRILRAYGFTETRIADLRGRGVAEMIYTLTDEDWASNGFHKHQEARNAA